MSLDEYGKPMAGTYVRLPDKRIYYVDCVTGSGAHLIPMTGVQDVIRDRKKREKAIFRHSRKHIVISSSSLVERIDPSKLDTRLLQRRITMAKREQEPQGQTEAAPAEKPAKERVTQTYTLTGKEPKETMRGQGKLVYDTLKAMGGAATVGALTQSVKETGQLQTRQDAERVVGFYLSKFKRDGIVTASNPTVAAEQAAASAV